MPFMFLDPIWLGLGLLLPLLLVAWTLRQKTLPHSNTRLHANLSSRGIFSKLPMMFLGAAFLLLVIAFAKPVLVNSNTKQVIDTRDIVVAADISGSMSDPISATGGATAGWCRTYGCDAGPDGQPNKQDLARHAIKEFITLRNGDRIELLQFDDSVYYTWPLSTDQKTLEEKADTMTYIGGGTNFDGPASDAPAVGPIQAAINDLQKYGHSKTKIFVMVTDGGSSIDPARMVYFEKKLEELNVHMYVIGVGDDWTTNQSDTQDLRKMVSDLHGVIINAGNAQELDKGIQTINSLEKSRESLEKTELHRDISAPFIAGAVVFLLLFLTSNALTRRIS